MTWTPYSVVFEAFAGGAVICGLVVAFRPSKTPGNRTGGVLVAALWGLMALVGLPATGGSYSAPKSACLSNMKQRCLGLIMYASDNDDRFPTAEHLADAFAELKNKSIYSCPSVPDRPGYATSIAVVGRPQADFADPSSKVMDFEADAPTNHFAGTLANMPSEPRHGGSDIFGFVDAHAKAVKRTAPRPQF